MPAAEVAGAPVQVVVAEVPARQPVVTAGLSAPDLYRQGLACLQSGDRAGAYESFLACHNSGEEIPAFVRQQLQDKLRELAPRKPSKIHLVNNEQAANDAGESLPITDMRMTRFFITLEQAVRFVVDSFEYMHGGELYVPRIPSMKIVDLAQAIAPGAAMHTLGLRPGEKLHEEMISAEEGRRALRFSDDRYIVQPDLASWGYVPPEHSTPVPDGFHYTSDKNDQWFTEDEIARLVQHLD